MGIKLPTIQLSKLSQDNCKRLLTIFLVIVSYLLLISPWGLIPLMFGFKECCNVAGTLQHEFFFYPYISMWISDQINSAMGGYGSTLIGQLLLPTAVFTLLVFIYRRHLSLIWAVSLALLAVSVITEHPFREFLLQLFLGDWIDLGSDNLPEILFFPVPSFSTLYFLAIFYLATHGSVRVMEERNLWILTILFSLIIYINAIDIIFALPFWFIYFPLKLIRKKIHLKKVVLVCLIQLALVVLVISPALFLAEFNVRSITSYSIDFYYVCVYLLTPLAIMCLLFLVQRIDPYDLLYRFRHVYILMLAEVVMLIVALTGIVPLNLQISQNRLAQFFAHTYYYLPIIYYASQSIPSPVFGTESSRYSKYVRGALHIYFAKYSALYLVPLIVLLCIYNLTSGIKYLEKICN